MTARAQMIAEVRARIHGARTLQVVPAPMKMERVLFLKIGRKAYQVASIADAVAKYETARDRSGVGASQMPRVTIVSENDTLLYSISYNGRVWDIYGNPLDGETDEQRVARAKAHTAKVLG